MAVKYIFMLGVVDIVVVDMFLLGALSFIFSKTPVLAIKWHTLASTNLYLPTDYGPRSWKGLKFKTTKGFSCREQLLELVFRVQ